MGIRSEIRKRIEKKRSEIASFETKLREAQVYVQALEDTLRLVPPEDDDELETPRELREGSMIAKAREAIAKAAKPLHINDLLQAVGRDADKDARAALSGSLAAYVRKNEIFTRPAPNTFGLIEMRRSPIRNSPVPPASFGEEEPEDQPKDEDVPF